MIDLALDTQALTEYTNPFPAHTVHFHISMEGGEQQWGGNTTFINSFSKTFSNIKNDRGKTIHDNIVIVPLVASTPKLKQLRATAVEVQLSNQSILVATTKTDYQTVFYIQPNNTNNKYFKHHKTHTLIKQPYATQFAEETVYIQGPEHERIGYVDELNHLTSVSLKYKIFNVIAPQFIEEILLPKLTNTKQVIIHDHFLGGSLDQFTSTVNNDPRCIKINWIHSLSSYLGLGKNIMTKIPTHTPVQHQSMTASELINLDSGHKPARIRAVETADILLTVSRFAEHHLHHNSKLAGVLELLPPKLQAIKSTPNLEPYSLTAVATQYGANSSGSPTEIKQQLQEMFKSGQLPLQPSPTQIAWQDKPIFFFMGRPTVEKGVQHILNAIREIDAFFIIVSRDIKESTFVQEVQKHQQEVGNVLLLGKDQTHKHLAMAIADYVLIPSLEESFGLVAGETAAMGMKVVMTEVGGLPEATAPCDECRIVIPTDVKLGDYSENTNRSFIEQLQQIVASRQKPDPDHIRQHTLDYHSPEAFYQSIKQVLDQYQARHTQD